MTERTCTAAGCDRRHCARGLCKKHYYAAGHGFTPRQCRVPGCVLMTTNKTGDGLCENHYARVRRHGTTQAQNYGRVRGTTLADVLHERSEPDGDCVLWTGGLSQSRYPTAVRLDDGSITAAHRASWIMSNGPIPEGLTVDHLCHNLDLGCEGGDSCRHRRCLNPDHMELVTQSVNSWRRNHRREFAAMVSGIVVQDTDEDDE